MMGETLVGQPRDRDHSVDTFRKQPELVGDLLKEHEESMLQTEGLGLRKLGPGLKTLIWFLRVYVLFMVVVVVYNVVQTVHP